MLKEHRARFYNEPFFMLPTGRQVSTAFPDSLSLLKFFPKIPIIIDSCVPDPHRCEPPSAGVVEPGHPPDFSIHAAGLCRSHTEIRESGENMTLSEAYEALLKLPQLIGDDDVSHENGRPLYPINPAPETAQNTSTVFWQDLMLSYPADY